jgi:hypothetical protein
LIPKQYISGAPWILPATCTKASTIRTGSRCELSRQKPIMKSLCMPAGFMATVFLFVAVADSFVCPGGEPPVNCLVDPCLVNKCPSGTICRANYCGGCNFDCIPNGGHCPKSKPPVHCTRNPCDLVRCRADAVCVPNYCGGCFADCRRITVFDV